MRRLAIHKALTGLEPRRFRLVVRSLLDRLGDPQPSHARRLENSNYWRIAVGEYHVVYRFDDACVHAVTCGKCDGGEVYPSLDREV